MLFRPALLAASLLAALLAATAPAEAQPDTAGGAGARGGWVRFGPPAGTLTGLAVTPAGELLLAASKSGVHRSVDRGQSWALADRGIESAGIRSVAADPDDGTLYAGGAQQLYRSTDAGGSWRVLYALPPPTPDASGGDLFAFGEPAAAGAGGATSGLATPVKVGVAGGAWVLGAAETAGTGGGALAGAASAGARPRTLYVARGRTLLRIVAGASGATARRVLAAAAPIAALAVDPADGASLFAGTAAISGQGGGALLHSADGGASWSMVAAVPPLAGGGSPFAGGVTSLAAAASSPTILFAVTGAGLYRSTDAGATWQPAPPLPAESRPEVVSVAVSRQPPFAVSVISELTAPVDGDILQFGVFTSGDLGASWRRSDRGGLWPGRLVADPASDALFILAAGSLARGGPRGRWRQFALGDQRSCGPDFGFIPPPLVRGGGTGRLYAVTGERLFRSSDGGATWSAPDGLLVTYPFCDEVFDVAPDPRRAGTLYAATLMGVETSADDGVSWRTLLDLAGPGEVAPFNLVEPLADGTLLAAAGGFGVYRSADAGRSWQNTLSPDNIHFGNPNDTDLEVTRLVVSTARPGWVYAEAFVFVGRVEVSTFETIFASRDGGQSWSQMQVPEPTTLIAPDPRDPLVLHLLSPGGVFASADGGQSWRQVSAFGEDFGDLAADPSAPATLWAARDDGVWRSRDGGASWRRLAARIEPEPASSVWPGLLGSGTIVAASDTGLFLGVFP